MMVVGVVWVLALPFEQLGEGTKIDEHALQPGQVGAPVVFADSDARTLIFDCPTLLDRPTPTTAGTRSRMPTDISTS